MKSMPLISNLNDHLFWCCFVQLGCTSEISIINCNDNLQVDMGQCILGGFQQIIRCLL